MTRNVKSIQEDAPRGHSVRVVLGHSRASGFMGESVHGRAAEMLRQHLAHPIAI